MTAPASGDQPTTGPPDRRTLRLLERQFSAEPIVEETVFDPNSDEPRELRVRLNDEQYPSEVTASRLDCRWFTTGDFSFHYVESMASDVRWECRWDRHPNAHDDRLHFHQPPAGNDTTGLELPSLHPRDVLSVVLAAVETRVEQRWDESTTAEE
ncbi:hypothetical protein SAMN04487967_2958 [Natronorubrum sediminis]|uniref:Uncharacterized protein n=1 Tax=Natronorubrum sediminis TaxID=640943 RepID=A0A1H6G1Z2_9EURY|nr:hypothetical protein [Natronorubrum sediminis]SEH17069.1 hypothetical protein SAMN04487967_2958 [Natronorubrum sediminis]